MKRKIIPFLFLIILLLIIVYATNLENHDSSEVLININEYNLTLKQAFENGFLNNTSPSPEQNYIEISKLKNISYHTGDEIFISVNNEEMSLNEALNSNEGLCSESVSSYSSNIIKGHSGDDISLNGKTLQEMINNQEFCCKPLDCNDLNVECGSHSDGCGGTINCDGCGTNEECQDGVCVYSCIPETCSSLGKECGSHSDGCGGTINCDGCSSGYTCTEEGSCIKQLRWRKIYSLVCSYSGNSCPIPKSRLNTCSTSIGQYPICPSSVVQYGICYNEGESCRKCDNFNSQQYVTSYVFRCQ